jgi:hypothetical protein
MKLVNDWVLELVPDDRSHPLSRLCDFGAEIIPSDKSLTSDDYTTLVQFYSLLENVYRNVLLRPYIPAYRTINRYCGRYRTFLQQLGTKIFEELDFEYHPPNLLTYKGTHQSETIKSAVLCCIFVIYYTRKQKKLLELSSDNQSKKQAQ